ncbi:hypothetical protein SZ55_0600 [Pseudomonas sp. FeS53a]|nr:hypothetical protein SZ55_0600 [Pseudomonas sp. FeS53a]
MADALVGRWQGLAHKPRSRASGPACERGWIGAPAMPGARRARLGQTCL